MGLLQAITSPTAVGAETVFPSSKERRKDIRDSASCRKDIRDSASSYRKDPRDSASCRKDPRDSAPSRKQPQVVREGLPVVGEEVELEGEEILASSTILGTQQEVDVFMLVRGNILLEALFSMNVHKHFVPKIVNFFSLRCYASDRERDRERSKDQLKTQLKNFQHLKKLHI